MVEIEQELQGKRILVTGGAGFIGSRLVKALLGCGAQTVVLADKGTPLGRIKPFLSASNLSIVECPDWSGKTLRGMSRNWGKIDLLAHLGLRLSERTDFCGQYAEDAMLNLLPTINLIESLSPGLGGICFASTIMVCGHPARLPITETDLPAPATSYAVTKLAIENFLRAYGEATHTPVTILRYSTVYGPGELEHRAIPRFVQAASNGRPPVVFGDGSEVRDYVYVDEVVEATLRALARRPVSVLNIGAGRGYSTLEVAEQVVRLCHADVQPRFVARPDENVNIVCDISAAKEVLGFSPKTSLEDGIREEIKWFRSRASNTPSSRPENVHRGRTESPNLRLYRGLKSVIDRALAFLGIVGLSPIFLALAIAIRLDSPGTPFFVQERVGQSGRKFRVYKFRSMRADNDDSEYRAYLQQYVCENAPHHLNENGEVIYKCSSPEVTRIGAFLRRTNLDELPQLVNVLKGEMSLVGPRPDVPFAVELYEERHRKRLEARPGITGLWQVRGRKNLSFEDMVRLDIDYIEKQSLLLDARILLETVGVILGRDGS